MNMKTLFIVLLSILSLSPKAQSLSCNNCTDSLVWQDKDSTKIVYVKVTQKGEIGAKGWDDRIYALYAVRGRDSLTKINEIHEAAGLMENIDYVRHSLKNVALEGSNTRSGCFFYEVEMDGLDDNTLKLVCFYNQNKIIIAGNVPKQSERANMIKWIVKNAAGVDQAVVKRLVSDWLEEAKKRMKKYISELE